jgi:Holliday junction resolvasome RuvABC endonuclease subunit
MIENQSVLWLDASSDIFGWAYICNAQLIAYGSFKPSDSVYKESYNPTGEMLHYIALEVGTLISKLNPVAIGIEDIFLQVFKGGKGNVKDYKLLSKIQGVLEDVIFTHSTATPVFFLPSEVRKPYKLNLTRKKVDKAYFITDKLSQGFSNSKALSLYKSKIHTDQKQIVIDYVNTKFNLFLKFEDNDIADAILGALFLYENINWEAE